MNDQMTIFYQVIMIITNVSLLQYVLQAWPLEA